ncbi:acyltransferase [Nostoc sp. CHAB 5824]|nr:acyltransferase [Nostoc sp. CHAB 5824]
MVKHITALTSLRGVAAILIVIHHYVGYLIPNLGKSITSYSKFFFNGYLCVDFFFILSGFILTHVYANNFSTKLSIPNYRAFLYSRFTKIYPLHVFMILLFLAVEFSKLGFLLFKNKSVFDAANQSSLPFSGTQNIAALFSNIFMIQALDLNSPPLFGDSTYWNEPAWSISAELIAYLLLPLLLFFLLKLPKICDLVIYLSSLICLFLLTKLTYGHLNFLGIPSIGRCTLEATIGILTYKVYRTSNYWKYLGLNFTVILSLLWVLFIMHYDYQDILIIPAFSLLILSASINKKNNNIILNTLNSSLLIYLGTISYSIYMVHWFIQKSLSLIYKSIFHVNFGTNFNISQSVIIFVLYILVVILTASLTHKLVELKMQHYLKTTFFAKTYIY